jgi:hypothetical protein
MVSIQVVNQHIPFEEVVVRARFSTLAIFIHIYVLEDKP